MQTSAQPVRQFKYYDFVMAAFVTVLLCANLIGCEILATPFTYKIVGFLKKAENVDHFDYNTNFTPFSLKE